MNFDDYKFRCSSLGSIMSAGKSSITEKQLAFIGELQGKTKLTEKQNAELTRLIKKRDNPELSTTCKSYLVECYVSEVFGREKEVYSKYTEKGLAVEEDAITLYSRVKKQFFKKNEERIYNKWIQGEPDLFEGESILKAKSIIDLKSSWDLFAFFKAKLSNINTDYEWQLTGYMDLTGADQSHLAYCLIDTPDPLINKEANKLMWDMGAATSESPEYLEAREALEKNMRFSDIPMVDRVHERFIRRDDFKIRAIPDRVTECREWLNELHHNLTEKTQYVEMPF
jgi:hypothetical protein